MESPCVNEWLACRWWFAGGGWLLNEDATPGVDLAMPFFRPPPLVACVLNDPAVVLLPEDPAVALLPADVALLPEDVALLSADLNEPLSLDSIPLLAGRLFTSAELWVMLPIFCPLIGILCVYLVDRLICTVPPIEKLQPINEFGCLSS